MYRKKKLIKNKVNKNMILSGFLYESFVPFDNGIRKRRERNKPKFEKKK